jgi:hypothetical protein
MSKRVKHVFANFGEVAHVWASQSLDWGRNSTGNVFFSYETIYSYGHHFPIARFWKMPNGRKVILFDDSTYSSSTSGHQNAVYWAIKDLGIPIIRLQSMLWHNYIAGRDWYVREIKDKIDLSSRATKYAGWHIEQCSHLISELHKWGIYNRRHPRYKFTDADKIILKRAKGQKAKIAERERLQAIVDEKRRQLQMIELKEKCGGDISAYWREHGKLPNAGFYAQHYLDDVLCRVVDGQVCTSMNAKVPIEHAKRLLPIVKACHDKMKSREISSSSPLRIGYYQVQYISAEGHIKIGCHLIKWPEVELLGLQLLPEMFRKGL